MPQLCASRNSSNRGKSSSQSRKPILEKSTCSNLPAYHNGPARIAQGFCAGINKFHLMQTRVWNSVHRKDFVPAASTKQNPPCTQSGQTVVGNLQAVTCFDHGGISTSRDNFAVLSCHLTLPSLASIGMHLIGPVMRDASAISSEARTAWMDYNMLRYASVLSLHCFQDSQAPS